MAINQDTSNAQIKTLNKEWRAAGNSAIPWSKTELLALFNAILGVWETAGYRTSISDAIDVAVPGLTNPQKKKLHEAAMRLAVKEGLL